MEKSLSPFTSLLYFIAFLLLTSCAEKIVKPYQQPERTYTSEEVNFVLRYRTLENQDKASMDHIDKPTGGLYTVIKVAEDTFKIRFCTASYLNNNEVITAAHCIPRAVRNREIDCKLLFFAHPMHNQMIRCESVKFVHKSFDANDNERYFKLNDIRVDMVILKMEKPLIDETPYELDTTPAFPLQDLHFPRYTLVSSQRWRFSESDCKVGGSFAALFPFRLSNCGPIPSNSGAPLLNTSKKIQGIIFGEHGYFTDVACLQKDAAGEYSWKSECPTNTPAR